MKDTMQTLTKLPKSTLLPAVGLIFFVVVAVAGVFIAQYQQVNRGPVTPNAPELSQAGGNVCTTSWIAKMPTSPPPTPSTRPSPSPSPLITPSPTPSPSPSPGIECEDCNYQVDAIWGPVINDFSKPYEGQSPTAPNARYSNNPNGSQQGTRLLGNAGRSDQQNPVFPGCQNIQPSGINAMPPVLSSNCLNPVGNGYLTRGDIVLDTTNNIARVTITNHTANCTYDVGLVSYKANWANGFEAQQLNDSDMSVINPGQSLSFVVDMPMNNDGPQCHGTIAQCPNYSLSAQSFSPLPQHTWWDPTQVPGDTDEITYLAEYPVNYAYITEIIEQQDNPPRPNIIYVEEEGVLNQGQTLVFNYPPAGQWGNPDPNGAYEVHTTVHFQYLDGDGQQCSYFGHNWDRWYHDTSANLVVRNNNLLSTSTISVMANGVVLKNRDGSAMTYTLRPRTEVNVTAGLPRGVTSVQLKSVKGAFQVKDVVITNNLTGQNLFDLTTTSSLKAGATMTYGR